MTLAARARTQLHSLSDEDAHEIAMEAYTYAYPLVLMELTRRVSTNVASPEATGRAPINRFGHRQTFPDASFTDVVRPNADTLYSSLWFDVSKEPLMIHVADAADRYYLLEVMDMWTDVFASPGTRTTGSGAQTFAIRGPKWMGPIPRGAAEIRSPTEQGWILGRTQTNGKADYDAVHRFQSRLIAKPYSDYGDGAPPRKGEVHADLDMSAPADQIDKLDAGAFYSIFARTARANPPHGNDYPVLARMARLGLEPGRAFDIGSIEHGARTALNDFSAARAGKDQDRAVEDGARRQRMVYDRSADRHLWNGLSSSCSNRLCRPRRQSSGRRRLSQYVYRSRRNAVRQRQTLRSSFRQRTNTAGARVLVVDALRRAAAVRRQSHRPLCDRRSRQASL